MAKKKDLKIAAKTAANSGALAKSQIKELKQAGVSKAKIASIKATNKQVNSTPEAQAAKEAKQAQAAADKQAAAAELLNQKKELAATGQPVQYGIKAQKAALTNYNNLVEQGVTDAVNPGKVGSFKNIMADGIVAKNELNKFAKKKGMSLMEAMQKIGSKGGTLSQKAIEKVKKEYEKKNMTSFGVLNPNAPKTKEGSLYDALNSIKFGKNNSSKDLMAQKGYNISNTFGTTGPGLQINQTPSQKNINKLPIGNNGGINSILGNNIANTPVVDDKATNQEDNNTGTTGPADPAGPADPTPTDSLSSLLVGGSNMGGGGGGGNATGVGKKKSKGKKSGLTGSTSMFARGKQAKLSNMMNI